MQIEAVQQLQNELIVRSDFLNQNLQKVKERISRTDFDWQGGRSKHFLNATMLTIRSLERSIEELHMLGIQLNREINQWMETDQF